MANLKARFEIVMKEARNLLSLLPRSYFLTKNAITINHLPKEKEVLEIEEMLGLNTGGEHPYGNTMAHVGDLIRSLDKTSYLDDHRVNESRERLTKAKDHYLNGLHGMPKKNTQTQTSPKPKRDLEDLSTRELKDLYKSARANGYSYYEEEDSSSLEYRNKLKALLSSREHVPSAAQSKLIRKMSIHAGKKLTLQEAQLLANQLKKTK